MTTMKLVSEGYVGVDARIEVGVLEVEGGEVEEPDEASTEDRGALEPAHREDGVGGHPPLVEEEGGEEGEANDAHADLMSAIASGGCKLHVPGSRAPSCSRVRGQYRVGRG